MNNTFVRAFLSMLLLASICGAWTNSQEAANRMGASEVKEFTFDKSSKALSEEHRQEIRNAINEAAQKGRIDEVKVLVWSDKEYPPEQGQQSKADRKLANERMNEIKKFLKNDLKISSVKTYNMTERPNALEKFFHTSDAKVKSVAEATGAAPTQNETGAFNLKAQASKGIVLVFCGAVEKNPEFVDSGFA